MLLDVTAVLSTSSTLNAVAEAFAVPASSRLSIIAPAAPTVDQAAWARATDPQLVPQDDPRDTRTLEQIVALVPFEVADWWATADEATRLNLVTSAPQVVGNLDDVPYTVRDAANRDYLGQTVASLQSRIADGSVGRAATAQLQAQLHMLQQVQDAIQTSDTDLPRTLVNLDIADGGRAVIAIGDLATADYISYLIPGMFYSVDSEIGSWTDAADLLAADQAEWLTRLTPAQHIGEIQTVATVAWIGYQAPTVVNVASLDLAREGRDALTESLRGLDAVRSAATAAGPASPAAAAGAASTTGVAPYVSVLAHSYGA
ncbi:MAG: alpha/beta hydrolase, partial [Pseudolysinimonas sp.]